MGMARNCHTIIPNCRRPVLEFGLHCATVQPVGLSGYQNYGSFTQTTGQSEAINQQIGATTQEKRFTLIGDACRGGAALCFFALGSQQPPSRAVSYCDTLGFHSPNRQSHEQLYFSEPLNKFGLFSSGRIHSLPRPLHPPVINQLSLQRFLK